MKNMSWKMLLVVVVLFVTMFVLTGCGNKDLFDTVYTYNYAIVDFLDGNVEKINVKQWRDYEDGEQIQIIAKDGTVYLVNSVNCILIKE